MPEESKTNQKDRDFIFYYRRSLLAGLFLAPLFAHLFSWYFDLISLSAIAMVFSAPAYLLLWFLSRFTKKAGLLLGGAIGAFGAQYAMTLAMLNSSSSTTALGLFYIPVLQVVVGLPGGALMGILADMILGVLGEKMRFSSQRAITGLAGICAILLVSHFSWSVLAEPTWIKPGVRVNTEGIEKRLLLADETLGYVKDIKPLIGEGSSEKRFVALGSSGAFVANEKGEVERSFVFGHDVSRFKGNILDVEGDGKYEFFMSNSVSPQDYLLSNEGALLWKLERDGWGESAYGDVDNDGELEFVILDHGGFRLYKTDGSLVWSQTDLLHINAPLLFADIDSDGNEEILAVSTGESKSIKAFDGTGNMKSAISPVGASEHLWFLGVVRYPRVVGDKHLLYQGDEQHILLTTLDGKRVVREFEVESTGEGMKAIPVVLKADAPPSFALFSRLTYRGRPRRNYTQLYLFDPEGKLIYSEVLPESASGIAAVRFDARGGESLLVGGNGKIWEYRLPTQ